ncbi:MAG: TIGR01212 family radical SAM protein [Candidatus Omnitrophica bacterium]|nr:TIGR01212 family radical SAM protein [Candidatus Omnitrophota bacterium]
MSRIRYSDYLKKRFGAKTHRICIDAGFSCPNRDGRISTLGCVYCDNRAFSYPIRAQAFSSIEEQIASGMLAARKRFKAKKFIAYFQAHTNTYAPRQILKETYDKVRKFKDIVSISIATRPDCVDDDVIRLIAGYAPDYEVWIEYGLQSIHDGSLRLINRGHGYNDFLKAFTLTRKYPIKICVHVILGLPGETEEMMMQTAEQMSRLAIDGIKIHPLYVVRGTALERMYNRNKYAPLSLEEYSRILQRFMGLLSDDIIVQRSSAYCPKDMLVCPEWVSERKNSALFF